MHQMANINKIDPKVFISYSHRDSEWLDRLRVHLRPLEREYGIDFWDDTRIAAGSRWKKEIANALETSKIAVLLVSADFLASEFVASDELPPLLTAAAQKDTIILPLILSPSRFLRTKSLSQFQAINDPMRPLINLTRGEQEEVLDRVAQRIETLLADVPQPAGSTLAQTTSELDLSTSRTNPDSKMGEPSQPTRQEFPGKTYDSIESIEEFFRKRAEQMRGYGTSSGIDVDTSDEIYILLRMLITEELGVNESEVIPSARFTDDLGADSLDTVELVMAAEEKFNLMIPDEEAAKISTVREAYRYLKSKR
jgi:acyl carrier protein